MNTHNNVLEALLRGTSLVGLFQTPGKSYGKRELAVLWVENHRQGEVGSASESSEGDEGDRWLLLCKTRLKTSKLGSTCQVWTIF